MDSSTTKSSRRSRRCSNACAPRERDILCSMGSSRATALALIVATTTAQAQPKASQVQIQQAGDLVKKAIAKSQAGDHTLAIELYQQAYNVIPTPILLSNIGSEYQQAQKPAEAVNYFCKYLTAEPVGAGAQFATTQVKS